VKHGGAGYAYEQGCRCVLCVEAWNARHRELRARRAQTIATDEGIQHGTLSTYSNRGCRCDACYQAKSEANRRRPSRAKASR
jgi:hypothetical protein